MNKNNYSYINNKKNIQDRSSILTEQNNPSSRNLDQLSTNSLIDIFCKEDLKPQIAVAEATNELVTAVDQITERIKKGGRLFYLGTGTSGRLGVLDSSECPPTFCTSPDLVQGVIAGGNEALIKSSEEIEDDVNASINDLKIRNFNSKDCLVGITAGGTTPYVISAILYANKIGSLTVSIACVPKQQAEISSDIDIRLITGPEVIAGSTRLKAGTATKMALNIISSSVMIKLGKVYDNLMVDLSATNHKLYDRSIRIITALLLIDRITAEKLLKKSNYKVKLALLLGVSDLEPQKLQHLLDSTQNNLRLAMNKINVIFPCDRKL